MFQDGLGTLQGYKAKILVDPGAVPRFNPARSVLYALRDKVDQELQRLQNEEILEPVETAEWAAPIVAVLKRDKSSILICSDFSVTVNPVSKLDRYPIPKSEDLFAKLANGKQFSKLDQSRLSTNFPGSRTQKVRRRQYSQGSLSVNETTLRDLLRYRNIPTSNGKLTPRD